MRTSAILALYKYNLLLKKSVLLRPAGYTLTELMVVITILGILAFAFARTGGGERVRMQEIESAAQNVLSALREARGLAISGSTVGNDDTPGGPATPEGGFGFFFDASAKQMIIFADVDTETPFVGIFDATEHPILSQQPPLEGLVQVAAVKTDIDPVSGAITTATISHTVDDPEDFWILFAANSLEVTFGHLQEGGAPDTIAENTKEINLEIGQPDFRLYGVEVNKVSRFLETTLLYP